MVMPLSSACRCVHFATSALVGVYDPTRRMFMFAPWSDRDKRTPRIGWLTDGSYKPIQPCR